MSANPEDRTLAALQEVVADMKARQKPSIFGYFDHAEQTAPTFDPGLDALCPHCIQKLERPVRTISLLVPGDTRSFFYRVHRDCAQRATEQQVMEIESSLVDSRAALSSGGRGKP